ncbi:MAG: MerR family transcriptional regulator [Rhodovibrio sp.]|nr:MerR family transcriptional regulator [Rhodovibrio sp.]
MAANRTASKSAAAFRTISEVSDELEVPQHVLRFWETKFTQVRPMKRGGGRRYYRPEDIELLRRIRDLLYSDGYTIKGVQKLLREGQVKPPAHEEAVAEQERAGAPPPVGGSALEADTAPEATAAAQPSGQARGQSGGREAVAARHPQTGRAEGPAARAATATAAQRPPQSGGQARQASAAQPSAADTAADAGLSREKQETIRSVLEELRAARADLTRRTGE